MIWGARDFAIAHLTRAAAIMPTVSFKMSGPPSEQQFVEQRWRAESLFVLCATIFFAAAEIPFKVKQEKTVQIDASYFTHLPDNLDFLL